MVNHGTHASRRTLRAFVALAIVLTGCDQLFDIKAQTLTADAARDAAHGDAARSLDATHASPSDAGDASDARDASTSLRDAGRDAADSSDARRSPDAERDATQDGPQTAPADASLEDAAVVAAISTGSLFACALLAGGSVSCWGYNASGQLGNGTTSNSASPTAVVTLGGNATAITLGNQHACALFSSTGTVACWGNDAMGQLGDGMVASSEVPKVVAGIAGATAIAAGEFHTCAVVAGGAVSCWGSDQYGQLGNGAATASSPPVMVKGVSNVTALAAGGRTTCAIANGALKCWGNNLSGQVGSGALTDGGVLAPVDVIDVAGATAVSVGADHVCAVLPGGAVKCWGYNAFGEVGNGTTATTATPQPVDSLTAGAQEVAAGYFHTCAVVAQGSIKCWGYNDRGELGDGVTTQYTFPQPVVGLTGASAIAAGDDDTCALVGGSVWCWGDNRVGQVGDGLLGNSATLDGGVLTPVRVKW